MAQPRRFQKRPTQRSAQRGRQTRSTLYAGKGGVGKTTTAAAAAARAAQLGERTLLASADPAHSLGDVLDVSLHLPPGEVCEVAPGLDAVELDLRREVRARWGALQEYLGRLLRARGLARFEAEEVAILPGVEELSLLMALAEHARSGRYDQLVVDCAPSASALRLLTLPDTLSRASRALPTLLRLGAALARPLGARREAGGGEALPVPGDSVFRELESWLGRRAAGLRGFLEAGTCVRIVATPERAVLAESRRLHTELCLHGLHCDAVIANCSSPVAAGEGGGDDPWERQRMAALRAAFEPLPVLEAPRCEPEPRGFEALARHGAALFGPLGPTSPRAEATPLRVCTRAGQRELRMRLPGATPESLSVACSEGELLLRAGGRRRALTLPRSLATASVESAALRDGELVVRFSASTGAES